MDQMTLALPSRDYYLKASSEGDMIAYHKYMTNIAILLGANRTTAGEELQNVVEFEKKASKRPYHRMASLPEQDRHDTSEIYKKLTLKELKAFVPQINWLEYFRSFLDVKITEEENVVAYGLSYFIEMGKIIAKTERREKEWNLGKYYKGYSARGIVGHNALNGPIKRMGMAVGALFIRENFNHDSKETALEMIHTIREAFNELLAHNDWMDDETRAVAKEKADAMNERIGYPKLITDKEELTKEYASLNITKHEFMKNILNILKFEAEQNLRKLRQPVDKDKWSTEPAVVNAFYNPNKNDIVFPAGILQPLFYSQHFPKSLNYGGIGVVIGHEITHGFDDKGRQFDKDGNMMQWWNNATIKAFRERTQCIIDQYSRYKIDEVGLYVNGRMTQGENIADNGGLKQSFRIWCGSMRPEDALTKVRSSVHSPGPIRVLGPLSNSRDFAEAYNCPLGSPMNPTDKCSVCV
ncbi:hypothetical protein NQ318_010130 [Aromia moschata]|uniref:Uncharacterized protein n=1 Tax=Aromia moschata TaxID=1265417 RepID=A0AAV8Y6P5_9CUCU|nr:hypothetical protein NQ318_010130 [Aromia moschata]